MLTRSRGPTHLATPSPKPAFFLVSLTSIPGLLLIGLLLIPDRPISTTTATSYACDENGLNAALSTGGTATFWCNKPATITVTASKVVTQDVILDGNNLLTITGGNLTRVFSVTTGVSVTLTNLTIRDGKATDGVGGGGIYNNGTVALINTILDGNAASSDGGGIYNTGTLTLTSSVISNNYAQSMFSLSSVNGGGVYNAGGTVVLANSLVSNNVVSNTSGGGTISGSGGGLYNMGNLLINASAVISNAVNVSTSGAASASGAGIFNSNVLTLTNSSILGNRLLNQSPTALNSGAGVSNMGIALLQNVTTSDNVTDLASFSYGGGLYNGGTGLLTILNSTISNNSAVGSLPFGNGGGGIYIEYSAMTSLTNTTVASNTTNVFGGGIYSRGTLTITNSTVVSNTASSGGSFYSDGSHPTNLKNVIVAYSDPSNCSGPITSLGHNLESTNTCAFTSSGDMTNTIPLLGPLQNNGGSTPTMALLIGSPAIDAGDNTDCPSVDQRIAPRPTDGDNTGGAVCDIGAYEFGSLAPNPAPALIQLSPRVTVIRSSPMMLTINGTNFISSSVALWNGQPLATTFVNEGQLVAAVPADHIRNPSNALITVQNPNPGGGIAAPPLLFVIYAERVFLPILSK